MSHQLEALTPRKQLSHRSTNLAAGLRLLLGHTGRLTATGISIAAQFPADGRRGSGDQAGNPTQTALGMTDLNGGALFNAEFGIRHRDSTVPEMSCVALSFCRRPASQCTDQRCATGKPSWHSPLWHLDTGSARILHSCRGTASDPLPGEESI